MQINQRLDVNGSDDKPFPQERNFIVNPDVTSLGNGGIYYPTEDSGNVANRFGQVKYARREGAVSIYKDETRQTANDKEASRKAEATTLYEPEGENEESQGI